MLRNESLIEQLKDDEAELIAIRRDLHAHPEIGLEEVRTSAVVAKKLAEWGWNVDTGLAKTGVVGTLTCGTGQRSIGIRADFDALPIHEQTGLPYASTTPGKMHACGHDGHTTMLLGAAKLLARRKNFDGTIHLIFQPAEENCGGAEIMMKDGLFQRFPCDAVFAAHNEPSVPAGKLGFREGRFMAAVDVMQVTIRGKGGHGAQPHETIDSIVAGAALVTAIQSVVARNIDPLQPAVVTVGIFRAGFACNVIPDSAYMEICYRHFDKGVGNLIDQRLRTLAKSTAEAHGCTAEIETSIGYPVLTNEAASTRFARDTGVELFGPEQIYDIEDPVLGSEDFAFMLGEKPGSYLIIGNGEGAGLHNPGYNFNDAIITTGAAYWTGLAERYLKA